MLLVLTPIGCHVEGSNRTHGARVERISVTNECQYILPWKLVCPLGKVLTKTE